VGRHPTDCVLRHVVGADANWTRCPPRAYAYMRFWRSTTFLPTIVECRRARFVLSFHYSLPAPPAYPTTCPAPRGSTAWDVGIRRTTDWPIHCNLRCCYTAHHAFSRCSLHPLPCQHLCPRLRSSRVIFPAIPAKDLGLVLENQVATAPATSARHWAVAGRTLPATIRRNLGGGRRLTYKAGGYV